MDVADLQIEIFSPRRSRPALALRDLASVIGTSDYTTSAQLMAVAGKSDRCAK